MSRMYQNQTLSHAGTARVCAVRPCDDRIGTARTQRTRVASLQKHMLALAVLVIIAVMILLGSRISTFASSHTVRTPLYKYYTSIQVEKGDSLWSIADDYIIDGVQSRDDFIDEVCQLNHISRQDILQSGEHLVIMYYSDEAK